MSGARAFPTTHWSLILSSAGETGVAETALSELCRIYWFPVYWFIRGRCFSPEEAQDLTQEFFLHLLNKGVFTFADPAVGRFRSFLINFT
jgi:DNA-directed RNA polymerase specialized sigma24 family protein